MLNGEKVQVLEENAEFAVAVEAVLIDEVGSGSVFATVVCEDEG